MKIKSVFIIALICILSANVVYSQSSAKTNRSKWLKEVREYKYDKLIEETEMTKAQQSEFFPLYSAMESAVYQVNLEARQMESKLSNSKDEISDSEYERVANALAEVKTKEAQIELEYYHKFEKILSKKQLFLLKRAETRFTRDMLNHHKRSQTSKKN